MFYVLLGRMGYARKVKSVASASRVEATPAPDRLRRLTAFVALGVASMILVQSVIAFIPLYIVDQLGRSEETGAAMLSLVYFGGLWAGPLGGYLSDRLGRVPVIIAVGLIAAPSIYFLNMAPFGVGISAVLIIMGMAMHLGMPVVEAYIISYTSERRRSTVLGIYYLGSRGGPAVAPLVGSIIDHHGFYAGFSVVAVAMAVMTFICAIFLWGRKD
jgi:MFS family permease